MRENQSKHDAPPIVLSLAVDASLCRVLDAADPLHEAVRQRLSQALEELRQTLGIPGTPLVQLTALDAPSASRFLRVAVNDQLCRYSDELLRRVYSYVCDLPLSAGLEPAQLLTWLVELSDEKAETGQRLVEFLSLICLETIKRQPAVLLGPAQSAAYLASLPDLTGEGEEGLLDQDWWRSVLAQTLNLKLSLADQPTVTKTLKKILARGRSPEEATEDLIAALRPDVVEIQLPPDDLRQLTTADVASERDKFALMRDGMFYELGLRYPKFHFVSVAHFKPNSFAFKLNHLTTLPWIGLPPDRLLVNDTPEWLGLLDIQGRAALNPANANESSLIDSSSQGIAEAAGLTTWDQMGYLVLCFSASLRENSACLLSRHTAQAQLGQLEQAFPALVKTVQTKFSVEQITRVLRSLLAEEISLRNLRLILECLVNYDFIVTDPAQYIIFDDRLPVREQPDEAWRNDPVNLTAFVRSGLKRYISHKYTKGHNTLKAFLLDPEIEAMLSPLPASQTDRRVRLAESEQEQILGDVRARCDALRGSTPIILTTIEARTTLRELIAPEFPRLAVLAYQELAPDLKIQRLS